MFQSTGPTKAKSLCWVVTERIWGTIGLQPHRRSKETNMAWCRGGETSTCSLHSERRKVRTVATKHRRSKETNMAWCRGGDTSTCSLVHSERRKARTVATKHIFRVKSILYNTRFSKQ